MIVYLVAPERHTLWRPARFPGSDYYSGNYDWKRMVPMRGKSISQSISAVVGTIYNGKPRKSYYRVRNIRRTATNYVTRKDRNL